MTVVGHGDDFTCAGTESGFGKIRPKLCEWCDDKRRGILGSGEQNGSTLNRGSSAKRETSIGRCGCVAWARMKNRRPFNP